MFHDVSPKPMIYYDSKIQAQLLEYTWTLNLVLLGFMQKLVSIYLFIVFFQVANGEAL